jgi:hypothetical protein
VRYARANVGLADRIGSGSTIGAPPRGEGLKKIS